VCKVQDTQSSIINTNRSRRTSIKANNCTFAQNRRCLYFIKKIIQLNSIRLNTIRKLYIRIQNHSFSHFGGETDMTVTTFITAMSSPISSFESFTYSAYSDAMQFAFSSTLDLSMCAYCGRKDTDAIEECPTCKRKNCKSCAETWCLPESMVTVSGIFCPAPRTCSKAVFDDSELATIFGKFGGSDMASTRR
jgi:hypothetical protein